MLRYDPSQESHTKYLTKTKEKVEQSQSDQAARKTTSVTANKCTSESFYKVSDSIKDSLHDESGNFSLLSMFGLAKEHSSATAAAEPQNAYQEVLQNKIMQKPPPIETANPFKYDSSDEDEHETASYLSKNKNESSAKNPSKNDVQQKKKLAIYERFFFTNLATDERLQGLLFKCF